MARNKETPWTQSEVEIKNIQELQTEIWVQESQLTEEDFKAPLKVSREDLKKFREEISQTPEALKYESIKAFIQEKAYVLDKSEKARQTIMWDGSVHWVIAASTSEVKEEIQKLSQETDPLKKLDWIAGMFDKIGNVWDKITLGISAFLWSKAPALAKLFWLDNPEAKIAEEAKAAAEAKAESTMEEVRQKAQTTQESLVKMSDIGYKWYAKAFFALFKPSLEINQKINIDSPLESLIINDLITNEVFEKTPYNNINSLDTHQKLLTELRKKDQKRYSEYDDATLISHIKTILGSIHGWEIKYTTGKWFWKEDHSEKITKGPSFIAQIYAKDGKTPEWENPTMRELFEKMTFMKDFTFLTDSQWVDFDKIVEAMRWWTDKYIHSSTTALRDLSDSEFTDIKNHLPGTLKNVDHFRKITVACMGSDKVRTLESKFNLPKNNKDSLTELNDTETNEFISWELMDFGNQFYTNVFQSNTLITGLNSVSKSDITLRDVYRLYMATGWETDPAKLNPIQKMNTTTLILFGFSDSEWIGKKLWDMTSIDKSNVQISEDVKNIFTSITKASAEVAKKVAQETWKFAWWFLQTNPELWLAIWLIMWKFPFLTKRQSFSDLASFK